MANSISAVKFINADGDDLSDIFETYDIRSLPTFLFFRTGMLQKGLTVIGANLDAIGQSLATLQKNGSDKPEKTAEDNLWPAKLGAQDLSEIKALVARTTVWNAEKPIGHVALLVVVQDEIKKLLTRYPVVEDVLVTAEFLNLARVFTGQVGGLRLSIVQFATSKIFGRHYSGYSQAAAIGAMVAKVLTPDLAISFGTAGGRLSEGLAIGDILVANGCLFVDRIRTSSSTSFNWGIWGGDTIGTTNLERDLGLRAGTAMSQIGYFMTPLQFSIMKRAGGVCLDMESAPLAEIFNQTQTNFMAIKAISNGIYPDKPEVAEEEYVTHREEVSEKATEALAMVLLYVDGKAIRDL